MVLIVWWLDLQLPVLCNQCLSPLLTKMSSNLARGEVYSIQHYVIKVVSDFLNLSPETCTFIN